MDILQIEVFEESELSMEAVRIAARERFKKICYVCKNCDGRDCPSGVPGMGGVGTGTSFKRNIESLKNYKIKLKKFRLEVEYLKLN